jgi:hypothetical protein
MQSFLNALPNSSELNSTKARFGLLARLGRSPRKKKEPGDFVRAYERLKLEIDRLKKHEDELDFFALELQSRRVLLGPWKGLPIAMYWLLSDYGRSYLRPLAWLFGTAALGASAFKFFGGLPVADAFGLSLSSMLNVFGFRKDFGFSPSDLSAGLKILSAAQTILGTLLLFLAGLGIRNKFRMK